MGLGEEGFGAEGREGEDGQVDRFGAVFGGVHPEAGCPF